MSNKTPLLGAYLRVTNTEISRALSKIKTYETRVINLKKDNEFLGEEETQDRTRKKRKVLTSSEKAENLRMIKEFENLIKKVTEEVEEIKKQRDQFKLEIDKEEQGKLISNLQKLKSELNKTESKTVIKNALDEIPSTKDLNIFLRALREKKSDLYSATRVSINGKSRLVYLPNLDKLKPEKNEKPLGLDNPTIFNL